MTTLRSELQKITGTSSAKVNGSAILGKAAGSGSSNAQNLPFPTIRNLPLLGAKYADYYRQTKIQETVYELLTEQYEMAKIQEAKEIPSVKVLDPAEIPERKTAPPRLIIILLVTSFVFAATLAWVLAILYWKELDQQDPRRIIIEQIENAVRIRVRSFPGFMRLPCSVVKKLFKYALPINDV